jgi:hypothetical protein
MQPAHQVDHSHCRNEGTNGGGWAIREWGNSPEQTRSVPAHRLPGWVWARLFPFEKCDSVGLLGKCAKKQALLGVAKRY